MNKMPKTMNIHIDGGAYEVYKDEYLNFIKKSNGKTMSDLTNETREFVNKRALSVSKSQYLSV